MDKEVQIVAFEGGELKKLSGRETGREAVLGLPLNRLIVKMVRIPPEADAKLVAEPILKAMNPYPDDELTVSIEEVRESESGKIVIAAALPESSADDIGEALDAAKLNVVKIDALAIGELRGVWDKLGDAGLRAVLIKSVDCISVIVLDGDGPVAIRAVNAESDLKLEVMRSLLEAEDFGGIKKLEEIVWVERRALEMTKVDEFAAGLEAFAPVRSVIIEDAEVGLKGCSARAEEEGTINALPASWRTMLEETRFKRKLCRQVAIAGGIWALIMAVLFGVPMVFGFMADYQRGLCKEHAKQYREVKAMKEKIAIVKKYSDHARGALEIMKAISDRLPSGVELSSWRYDRLDEEKGEGGVHFDGESDEERDIYNLEGALEGLKLTTEGDGEDEGDKLFEKVRRGAVTPGKGGKQRFGIDCLFVDNMHK